MGICKQESGREESVVVACRAFWVALRMAMLGLWALQWPAAQAGPDDATRSIAVVYPDIGEPFRSVFTTIINGVEDRAKGRVVGYPVSANASTAELAAELRKRDIRSVIALGRNGMRATASLDRSAINVVAGGVLSVPEAEAQNATVLSLAPDPALLFARLKSLVPNARRVLVVYDPRQNGWLIKLAREAAKVHGLELVAQEADDLKAAVRLYQELLSSSDARRDALWLPQDSITVDESAVLPLVLREAWNQSLPLFSSSVAHVKRGALFSLYPDNMELGRALASTALTPSGTASPPARGLHPLKDVLMAVNTRTASHLGINLTASSQRFHLVFPEP